MHRFDLFCKFDIAKLAHLENFEEISSVIEIGIRLDISTVINVHRCVMLQYL